MRTLAAALLASFLAFAGPATAQTQNADFPRVDMNQNMIRALLASMTDVQRLADKYDAMAPADDSSPVGAVRGLALSAAARAELNAAIGAHGFGDYQTWIIVAQNVFTTFTWVKMGDMQQQLSGALAAINNNNQLTEEQKKRLRAQIGGANAEMAGLKPSDHNIALVTGMLPEIEAAFATLSRR